MINKRSHNMNE